MNYLGGLLAALLVFGLLAGAVLGWVSALTLGRLRTRLAKAERALVEVEAQLRRLRGAAPGTEAESSRDPESAKPREPAAEGTPARPGVEWTAPGARSAPAARGMASAARTAAAEGSTRPAPRRDGLDRVGRAFAGIRDHWMVWLGGLSIGLAGIFLVRYSIEQGYLGPTARVLLGIATGLGLHVLAEWLRRRCKAATTRWPRWPGVRA